MDTLSRDSSSSNSSIMPLAGVILGAISLVVGIFAMVNANKLKATVAAQEAEIARISSIETEMRASATKSETDLRNLRDGVQSALTQVGTEIGSIRTQLAKVEEDMKKRAAPAAKGGSAAAPTGVRNADGTYTIAAGDTLAKVAKKFGMTLDAILAENPGIEPSRLRVGQKVRLPAGR